MADAKSGNLLDRFNTAFSLEPIVGAGRCPLRSSMLAIVPMRYALDRSHHDEDPTALTPLPSHGQWPALPQLQTRQWTLRQLRDGYLYVYDETDGTLLESRYAHDTARICDRRFLNPQTAELVSEQPGLDDVHLVYPRSHRLYLAWSAWKWTPSLIRDITRSVRSRQQYMQLLDLAHFSQQLVAPGALPLWDLNHAVADIYKGQTPSEGFRFGDQAWASPVEGQACTSQASEAIWLGRVPDFNNALFVALPDPLDAMADLSQQLAGDQAALDEWQSLHGHRLLMAEQVEQLCGVDVREEWLPESVVGKPAATRRFVEEVERYMEAVEKAPATTGPLIGSTGRDRTSLRDWEQYFLEAYGEQPAPGMTQTWSERAKWRREVLFDDARAFINDQAPIRARLQGQQGDSAQDLIAVAEFTGPDPKNLYVDITDAQSLQSLYSELVDIIALYGQDADLHPLLRRQEDKGLSLLALARFGFSPELKRLLDEEVNQLFSSVGDLNSLMGRLAELNAFLGSDAVQQSGWARKLSAEGHRAFLNFRAAVKENAGDVFTKLMETFLPIDLGARGESATMAQRFKRLWVSGLLSVTPVQPDIDLEFERKFKDWARRLHAAEHALNQALRSRFRTLPRDRVALNGTIRELNDKVEYIKNDQPLLVDAKKRAYLRELRRMMVDHMVKGILNGKAWNQKVTEWLKQHGGIGNGVAYAAVVMNVINTAVIYHELSKLDWWTRSEKLKFASAVAYTGQAMAAIWVNRAWVGVKDLRDTVKGEEKSIFQRKARFWEQHTASTRGWGKLIRSFGAKTVALGGFGVIAAATEYFDLESELSMASDREYAPLQVKKWAVGGMGLSAGIQLGVGMAGVLGVSSGFILIMSVAFGAITLLLGVIYLAAHLIVNYLKRDVIGAWLAKGSWSNSEAHRVLSPEQQKAEFNELREIVLMPSIFIEPELQYHTKVFPTHTEAVGVRVGTWLRILFPAQIKGHSIWIRMEATDDPLLSAQHNVVDNSFGREFLEQGTLVSEQYFSQPVTAEAVHWPATKPLEHEGLVWMSKLSLPVGAEFLEIQILYPPDIMPRLDFPQGYRFKIPLNESGELGVGYKLLSSDERALPSQEALDSKNYIEVVMGVGH